MSRPAAGHAYTRVVALTLLLGALTAAERVDLAVQQRPVDEVLAMLRRLGMPGFDLPPDTDLSRSPPAITITLRNASVATVRQALAHACGSWWAMTPANTCELTRERVLPAGTASARTRSSALRGQAACEVLAVHALTPWLGQRDCGLVFDPPTGLWSATLDTDGHARLQELIVVLERGTPVCPPDLADPDQDPDRPRLDEALTAQGWIDLQTKLAAATGCSLSLGADLPPAGGVVGIVPGGADSLRRQLSALGLASDLRHGCWCLSRKPPLEGEHPASRRRLALLPLGHLSSDDAALGLLVARLQREVEPDAWTQPGWLLERIPGQTSLLIAADPPAIHTVLAALSRIDLLGLDVALSGGTLTP